jgi:hypothetical protein
MKNITTTTKYVVKQYNDAAQVEPVATTEFAFIEDAERVFNFNSKTIRVFKRKETVEEEEIPTESTD